MSGQILDGKKVAQALRERVAAGVQEILGRGRPAPILATILVGEDPASATYVEMKGKACAQVGMGSERIRLAANISQADLLSTIEDLNSRPDITGILLQHPIPAHLDERAAFEAIARRKDVDGVGAHNFGLIALGEEAFPCCTPAGIMQLLAHYNLALSGLHAVVIGRSPILGKPMAMMLLNAHATVSIAHSRTQNLPDLVRQADLVVAAVGKPAFVKGDWVKPGAIVIDAGYNAGNIGDCDYDGCSAKASWITPVPGGVGPMTIATLLHNTLQAALLSYQK